MDWTSFEDIFWLYMISGLVTIVLSVSLRAFLAAAVQVLFLLAILNLDFFFMAVIGGAAQVILSALVLYKYIMAIEMNYQLILEKTHQVPVSVSGDGNRGSRFSFWKTK